MRLKSGCLVENERKDKTKSIELKILRYNCLFVLFAFAPRQHAITCRGMETTWISEGTSNFLGTPLLKSAPH